MSKYIKQTRYADKIVSRRMRMTGNDFAKANYLADILNIPNCATADTEFNTGVPLCRLKKKKIIGVIFADSGVYFTAAHRASAAAFLTELDTKTTAARGSRAYPLWNIRNFEDQTGEPQKGALGNLTTSQANIADGIPVMNFGYDGDEIQHQVLSIIETGSYSVFLVDENYVVYGTKSGDNMIGFSIEDIYVPLSKFPVSDFVNQYSFNITFSSMTEWKSNSAFVVTTSGITAKVGLINITLSQYSLVSNVAKLYMIAKGGTNVEPLYGAALDGLTWTAQNATTGAAITVTSVATDATNDVMGVTIDSTEYTALASGTTIKILGPTPAAMAAVSIKPFEFVPVVITKP